MEQTKSETDRSQDIRIEENAVRITRNEEAIRRQTEALEKIRDHYYPPPKTWTKKILSFFGKVICVIVAYLGIVEAIDMLWKKRVSEEMASEYAATAHRLFFEEGNAIGAVSCYEKAIKLDGGESDYKVALTLMQGMSLASELLDADRPLSEDELKRLDQTMADAMMLQESDPENPMPHVLMSQTFLLTGDREASIAEIARAVECDPENASVRVSACAMCFFAGKYEESKKHLAQAERLNSNLPLVASWKGLHALMLDHDAVAAAEQFRTMTKRNPRLALGHVMLGRALLALAKPDVKSARESFARALTLDARQKGAAIGMADTYEREGNLEVARLWLDRAIDNDARAIGARIARARVSGKLGDWKSADDDLTAAIAVDRFRVELYRLRADARERAGDRERAKSDRLTASQLERR